jgi:hypothetical protein
MLHQINLNDYIKKNKLTSMIHLKPFTKLHIINICILINHLSAGEV